MLDWIMGSVVQLLDVMSLNSIQSLQKRIKDHELERRNIKIGDSFHGYEVVEKQEEINELLDRVRTTVI